VRRASLLVALLIGTTGAPAWAQHKAAASAAFDRGRQLMSEGKTAAACTEFERSQQLDPQFGTQYHLALCWEALGKLASAYGELDELAGKDTNPRRRADARKRADALRPRLTHLTLIVQSPAPQLVVQRDDEDVTLLVGVTTPVDPGVYVFRASAPGFATWEQRVELTAEGATIQLEIPRLAPADVGADPDPASGRPGDRRPDGPRPRLDERRDPDGARSGRGRRRAGMLVTGAGVAATGVGLYFGLAARTATEEARTLCGGRLDPCTGDLAAAQARIDDARGQAMVSNLLVGAGLAAVGAGLVLWLTAPDGAAGPDEPATRLTPRVGPHGVGLVLDGRF
jgi:hypothetical protein